MAVIRLRKRNLLLAGLTGVLLSSIPLGISSVYFYRDAKTWKQEWEIASQEMDARELHKAYHLKTPATKGTEITQEDLVECEVYTSESFDLIESSRELVGMKLKMDTGVHAILQKDMVYQEQLADDVRLQEFGFIELNQAMLEGSYIDVRISFPNGEDYVVAEHKRIERREEASIFFHVSEEEILLMSSTQVDMESFPGARVYGILYAGDYQNPASKDYPANQHVCELADWNPNIIKEVFTEENKEKRRLLEQNLKEFQAKADGLVQ